MGQFGSDLKPLFDTILEHIAPPEGDETAPLGMLVSSVDYSSLSLIHIAVGILQGVGIEALDYAGIAFTFGSAADIYRIACGEGDVYKRQGKHGDGRRSCSGCKLW